MHSATNHGFAEGRAFSQELLAAEIQGLRFAGKGPQEPRAEFPAGFLAADPEGPPEHREGPQRNTTYSKYEDR